MASSGLQEPRQSSTPERTSVLPGDGSRDELAETVLSHDSKVDDETDRSRRILRMKMRMKLKTLKAQFGTGIPFETKSAGIFIILPRETSCLGLSDYQSHLFTREVQPALFCARVDIIGMDP